MMRVLVIGNHTCGNRGDSAILRGLIETLEAHNRDVSIEITSRFSVSSTYLLGRPVMQDPFSASSIIDGRVRRKLLRPILPWLLLIGLTLSQVPRHLLLPAAVRRVIETMRRYDLVIQVGGSFFVNSYGIRQFEAPFAALLANRPLVLAGHSIGPIEGRGYGWFIRCLCAKARQVYLRESVSAAVLKAGGIAFNNVVPGADTAWAVTPTGRTEPRRLIPTKPSAPARPKIAVSMRSLKPFDRTLGVNQAEFERAFACLIERLSADGFDVIAVSTCTGIESYHNDDRIVALRVKSQLASPDDLTVFMDELNDIQLGELYRTCVFVIGTRLHSAIIALNYGTPALAINYEHKSRGILRDMGLADLSADIAELLENDTLYRRISLLVANLDVIRDKCKFAVDAQRLLANRMIDEITDQAR